MAELSELLEKIQQPEKSHVDMIKRRSKGTPQWFLERDHATHPIHDRNKLDFFMCGKEGFEAIEQDIIDATSSIDIVLWGFDPGMALTRHGDTWPHGGPSEGASLRRTRRGNPWPQGTTYGELLVNKARQGVKVRLLVWWNSQAINRGASNVPDMPWLVPGASSSKSAGVTWPDGKQRNNARTNSSWVLQERANFCSQWWKDALSGAFENLEVRMRSGKSLDVMTNLARYMSLSSRDLSENGSMIAAATHHQKPILIDYLPAPGKKPNTCGYVMGLNSVTDYWDTAEHLFNDPRRELSPNAYTDHNQPRWHLKPYRDYAIRVQGEALYNLNENFVQGWDSADIDLRRAIPMGPKLADERAAVRPRDLSADGGTCRVQILRTQPEKKDATILKAYTLASANALSFIYLENQYFQLPEWPGLLRNMRQKYRQAMKEAGASPSSMAPLHLFVVVPQAERSQMVPRTYETVGALGAGDQMQYDRDVRGERDLQKWESEHRGTALAMQAAMSMAQPLDALKSTAERKLASKSAATVPPDAKAQLEALGIKPLVAMLMSYDHQGEARNIRIKARDSNAQEAQAAAEAAANRQAGKNGKQADDVDPANLSKFNIRPKPYREIYIHSKLMIVDDVYLTLGSANLNARSMAADSELNLCTEEYPFTSAARRRVWGNLAGKDLDGGGCTVEETAKTHERWLKRMLKNEESRTKGSPPEENSFIHPLEDPRGVPWVTLA